MLTGLSPTELDWMTSDLTFIQFHRSWTKGFAKLLKKLKSVDAPRNVEAGRASVCDWMAVHAEPANKRGEAPDKRAASDGTAYRSTQIRAPGKAHSAETG